MAKNERREAVGGLPESRWPHSESCIALALSGSMAATLSTGRVVELPPAPLGRRGREPLARLRAAVLRVACGGEPAVLLMSGDPSEDLPPALPHGEGSSTDDALWSSAAPPATLLETREPATRGWVVVPTREGEAIRGEATRPVDNAAAMEPDSASAMQDSL